MEDMKDTMDPGSGEVARETEALSNIVEETENLSNNVEEAENLSNDVEMAENLSNDVEKQEEAGADGALEAALWAHIADLEAQGEALKGLFPGFDLRRELQNPMFARLTAPDVGLSVEDAYFVAHRRQLQAAAMQTAARRTAQRITNAIASGMRPVEHGVRGQAPSVAACDYRSMSPQQRQELKARIRAGEKIYP